MSGRGKNNLRKGRIYKKIEHGHWNAESIKFRKIDPICEKKSHKEGEQNETY